MVREPSPSCSVGHDRLDQSPEESCLQLHPRVRALIIVQFQSHSFIVTAAFMPTHVFRGTRAW